MTKYNSPGIYIESSPKRMGSIKLSISGLAGFIGIAEKGPLHRGVRIKNYNQFMDIFGGFSGYGNLAYAVFGYFNAGGRECIVVRTAHLQKDQDLEAVDTARKACLQVLNTNQEECLKIEALSEGIWGNYLRIKLWYNAYNSTPLAAGAAKGTDSIDVQSDEGFEPGDTVCLRGSKNFEYKKVRSVRKNRIFFESKLDHAYKGKTENIICEKLHISLAINCGKDSEEYLYLSLNENESDYYLDQINNKSRLISLQKNGTGIPDECYNSHLQEGRNGIIGLTPADFIGKYEALGDCTGLGIFEGYDEIYILAAPDLCLFQELPGCDEIQALENIFIVQMAMAEQCDRLGNRFAVLDAPEVKDSLDLIKYCSRFDTRSAAVYYPKIEILNPEDFSGLTSVIVPPSGHVAGQYVKCDLAEGLHRAPANKFLQGAVGLRCNIEDEEYDILYQKGINCMKYVPGRGIKIWGARTLSSEPEWRYINVRRTFCAIRDALKKGVAWAVFEPNDRVLRKRLIRHVSAFLLDLWRLGYMKGTVPEDGFYIHCDDELNPPENIEQGIITIEAGICIARPAEYLIVTITANTEDSVIAFED